ncbi:enolase-phosphatase E1-like [Oppia nitens]|uniref:enolase-phosphatase E1-like n=1 Tax=Oppia nitens TaxID=1686743 RepID=UPI0023DB4AFB|nr:enolase-phosphatase E1-like [Oppia nitens]
MTSIVKMKQPYKVLIDIWGVITSWTFRTDLKTYIKENLKNFLSQHWTQQLISDFVHRLRDMNAKDREIHSDLPQIEESTDDNKDTVIESVVKNIEWRKKHKLNTFDNDIQELYQTIWLDGYRNKRLKVHTFVDVMPSFQRWTDEELTIKIYTFASGPSQNQKLFLNHTTCGDVSWYVVGGINSYHKYKHDSNRFKQVFIALQESPQNILYITDSPNKARAAIASGMRAIVVLRDGNKRYSDQELDGIQTVTSLQELDFIPDYNPNCC